MSTNPFPVTVKPFKRMPVPMNGRDASDPTAPLQAWLSDDFLVQLYFDTRCKHLRLSVNRVQTDEDGLWLDGISWDELQAIKAEVGYGHRWAVEVYPPESEVVNVANMRHLFLLAVSPAFGWVRP